MSKRSKILTSLLLTAALALGSMTTGFAAEISVNSTVSEDVSNESIQEEANVQEAYADEAGEDAEQTVAEESVENSAVVNEADNGAPEAEGETETVTIESVSLSEDEAKAELKDDQSTTHEYTTIEKSKEYDGNEFRPDYKVPAGHILLSENKYNKDKKLAAEGETYTFPGIKFVSESQTMYVYPVSTDPAVTIKDDDYDFVIKSSITKRPITFRSGTYTKVYDGTPLSQNSAIDSVPPKAVKGSMVGSEKFSFTFDASSQITNPGSVPNKFSISTTANSADPNNYDISYEYGKLIISEKRGTVNSLPTPQKVKAVIDNKGVVKLSWKKVSSYKDVGKKGGKTSYKVYRYRDDGTWKCLTEATYKKKFVDSDSEKGELLIYKIVAVGMDSGGNSGECENPAYIRVTPKIVSVSPYDGIHYANVNFMGFGTEEDTYILEHWNSKNKGVRDQIDVTKYNSEQSSYIGKKRTISTNNYLDAGGTSVTISGNNKASFGFRVKARAAKVYDYGKEAEVPETPWSKASKIKMVSLAPYLRGERKNNTAFRLKWDKIKKATGYLVEYSKDSKFSKLYTTSVYVGSDKREYDVNDVGYGIPYYCRVTSYMKKKGDGSEYGVALGTSQILVQYGRHKKVESLEAEYYEDGNYKADAKLTWKDNEDNIRGYYVQRWSYAYNPATKAYDKETSHEVLQGYTSENSARKKYANTIGGKINNGELIKYRVQSVRFYGGNTGENHDGYVFSDPAEYYYMNPSEVDLKNSKYSVKVGVTLVLKPTIKPKKLPKKADGLTEDEFDKVFEFNDKLEYTLQSNDLTSSEIKKYVTVDANEGKLKGIKTRKKSGIEIKVSSPNDPSNVYDTATVYVITNPDEADKEESDSTDLVVCIDPGHGGKDDGAVHNGITEKDKNLEIAKKVGKYLKDKGAKVYYTRTDDTYVSLTDRTDYAEDKKCNLFVSIHCNASDDAGENGTEVYYSVKSKYAKESLAKHIAKGVADALGTRLRDGDGARTRQGNDGDYYSVIRTSAAKGIPGLIVEHAFTSNGSDAAALKDGDKLDAAAKAEAEAIYKYWNK